MQTVAVFCGSNFGVSPAYRQAAGALGAQIAARGLTLVYGGTRKGLMGVVADAALAASGSVHGVINLRLHERGHSHPGLTVHEIAHDMRDRKARMAERADAFIALPGGLGTLEELFEMATLTQLADHTPVPSKACGVLNVNGFYDPMRAMLDRAVDEGFMKPEHRDMFIVDADPSTCLDRLAAWQPPVVDKWIAQPGS